MNEPILFTTTATAPFKGAPAKELNFYENGKVIGTLHVTDPMRFEGDIEKSAESLFKCVLMKMETFRHLSFERTADQPLRP